MAKFRYIHTAFWDDPDMLEFTPEQKYFYLYLLTNPAVKQCGIYEISIKTIKYQTGYNSDTVEKLLEFFQENKKIVFSRETSEICLTKYMKYNNINSPKVKKCIVKELADVKNKDLIQYIYGIDTLSIPYGNRIDKNNNNNKNNKEEYKEEIIIHVDEKILNDVLSWFGFSEMNNFRQYAAIVSFLNVIQNAGRLDHFVNQFHHYRQYKDKSCEIRHGWKGFLGSADQDYTDGGWNAENWQQKNQNLQSKQQQKEPDVNSYYKSQTEKIKKQHEADRQVKRVKMPEDFGSGIRGQKVQHIGRIIQLEGGSEEEDHQDHSES